MAKPSRSDVDHHCSHSARRRALLDEETAAPYPETLDLEIVWQGSAAGRHHAFLELSQRPARIMAAPDTYLITGVTASDALRWLVRHVGSAHPVAPGWLREWLCDWLILRASEIRSGTSWGGTS